MPYIVFHLKTYVCGKVIERNWEYFNEDTFIISASFPSSLVGENSPRSCVELSEAHVFVVMLIEEIAFTPRKLSFKY